MEHEFTTGRKVEIREALPMHVLIRRAVLGGEADIITRIQEMQDGTLTDPLAALRMQDAIVAAMWVRPRVVLADFIPGEGEVSIDDLTDEEMTETVELALGGVADAATFPGDGDGQAVDGDRKGVGHPPKRRAGTAKGKR